MTEKVRIITQPGIPPTEIGQPSEQEPWFKPHPLVLINSPQILGEFDPQSTSQLVELTQGVFKALARNYQAQGCPAIIWDEEKPYHFWEKNREFPRPLEPSPHAIIINPVFLGAIPKEAKSALRTYRLDPSEGNHSLLRTSLRDCLPEMEDPLANIIGKQITYALNVEPALHPNFINTIFIEDNDGLIRGLPYQGFLAFQWTLMAKLGAFKEIIVPYQRNAEGAVTDTQFILATLEGGHPTLEISELARRLMVYGSGEEVGGYTERPEFDIPAEAWANSTVVEGLISLGKFLGERNVLSSPVVLSELVKDQKLAKLLSVLARWSRQAEGAFMAFDPEIRVTGVELPWAGLPILTSSGRFGAVKTDLTRDDLVAVVPRADGMVEVPLVGGNERKGPSVEAEEFTIPLLGLASEYPGQFLIRLSRVENGYILDSNGDIVVPCIRGVIHIHRGFESFLPENIIATPANLREFPPVGCGNQLMQVMSKDAMKRAVYLWHESGQKIEMSPFYVPNHGTNFFIFWTPNKDGTIPLDPFEQFKNAVQQGELVLTQEVPQV